MTLNIFGKKIRVLKVKNLARDHQIRGYFQTDKDLIGIDSEMVGIEYLQTVLHELVHAVIDRTGIDQSCIPEGVEEVLCENIATALVENFKIRPK